MGIIDKFKGLFNKRKEEENQEEIYEFINGVSEQIVESGREIGLALQKINKEIYRNSMQSSEIERLTKIMSQTKNKRSKNKLLKRIEKIRESGFNKSE